MTEQMGPQARVRETVETLSDALARLPKALGDLERTVDVLAQNRIQLDPETVAALRSEMAGPPRCAGAVDRDPGAGRRRGGAGLGLGLRVARTSHRPVPESPRRSRLQGRRPGSVPDAPVETTDR